tara:strand:- start:393 stop:497 length:105 start_codon:yes stop_codon:yes gene_type:complete
MYAGKIVEAKGYLVGINKTIWNIPALLLPADWIA